ncbi:MAG: RlmE family RNA methyltransferase [Alphaproteobacteria bacterium]|nr:MAG: RlmE family RNA methyltransferase [Alphaproteobacteria bacterium]
MSGGRRKGPRLPARRPGAAPRLKKSRKRKASSTRWLQRQLSDPYVLEARRRGYRSRAAFKLAEIDDRFHLLAGARRAVDLGAAPGGWSQVLRERMSRPAQIVAVDILEMDPIPGVTILRGDFLEAGTEEAVRAALEGHPADLVVSDMAAPTTGHRATDHLRTLALAEAAYAFARTVLAEGGAFVTKIYQGGAEGDLLAAIKRDFGKVRHWKPPASRPESVETYLIARAFRRPPEPAGSR